MKARIRWSKNLRIPIRIRIRDTPNFAYPYFSEHWLDCRWKFSRGATRTTLPSGKLSHYRRISVREN